MGPSDVTAERVLGLTISELLGVDFDAGIGGSLGDLEQGEHGSCDPRGHAHTQPIRSLKEFTSSQHSM